jgi:4-amino-4-deoxy-L-arabinose transferase-like glycosyltransferase
VRFPVRLALIAAAGLALRVAYVLLLAHRVRGSGDSFFFDSTANFIAKGYGFADPFPLITHPGAPPGGPSAAHPPLWSLVLSVPSLLGATGEVAHKLTTCMVGSGTIMAVGLLGRRVGGERSGLVSAALAAAYPVLVGADGTLLSESLFGLLVALALLASYALIERPTAGRAVLLGGAIGLAALTRSEGLLLIILLALPAAVMAALPWRARLGLAAAALAAMLVVIAPWTVRNVIRFERPVLISTNDGTLLAGANCDATYHGPDLGFWNFHCLTAGPAGEDESQQAARLRRQGVHYAAHHAGRLPVVLPVRLLRTWDLYQPVRQTRIAEGRNRWIDRAGVVCYFLLLPLAALGLIALRQRRPRPPLAPLAAPVALITITSLLGYGVPRLRHAAEITLVVLAAAGIERLLERRDRRHPARSAALPERAPAA